MPTNLLSEIRNYLVAQGVVRKPSTAGALPPMWLEPQSGTPAPGEGNNPVEVGPTLVVAAYLTGGFAQGPYESWLRKPVVDFRFRSKGAGAPADIENIDLEITRRLTDKRDWMMAAMYVVQSSQYRALQRIGADTQGYEYVSSFWFELYRPGFGIPT